MAVARSNEIHFLLLQIFSDVVWRPWISIARQQILTVSLPRFLFYHCGYEFICLSLMIPRLFIDSPRGPNKCETLQKLRLGTCKTRFSTSPSYCCCDLHLSKLFNEGRSESSNNCLLIHVIFILKQKETYLF